MMSIVDPLAISVETPRIDLGENFTKLVCMNHLMVLYLTVNHINSCHG